MTSTMKMSLTLAVVLLMVGTTYAQETENANTSKTQDVIENAHETADAVVEAIDENEQAQEVSAGILKPIYSLAESFSFPAFHWIAFALMVTGVVSFALQLTFGKLAVLAKLGFSPTEILSDILGLIVSLMGLVLTTQAAAENSSFTSSALAVLSSTVLGVVVGFIFYLWGQRQELQAVEGRKKQAAEAANDE